MASSERISYEAICVQAEREAFAKLGEMVLVDSWSGWHIYPFYIDNAPTENGLMQSLQRYHKQNVIPCTFQLVAAAWATREEMEATDLKKLPIHEIDVVITSLTNMQPKFFGQRSRYVFVAEVVSGDHEGKVMVGHTLTPSHNGGCYLFGESSPEVYLRLTQAIGNYVLRQNRPITADKFAAGDYSKVPETDRDFAEMMFTAKTIHNEKVAGGMIPLSADWMKAMNQRWY